MKYLALVLLLLVGLASPALANYSVVYGEILEVNVEASKVRVRTGDRMEILLVADRVDIYRDGQQVYLQALRPIAEGRFQDGLFLQDSQGTVTQIIVSYRVQEVEGALYYFGLFGEIKEVEQL